MEVCEVFEQCSGCSVWSKPLHDQHQMKLSFLRELMDKAELTYPSLAVAAGPQYRVRDRVDLTLEYHSGGHRLGLLNKDKSLVVDLPRCPMLSLALEQWLIDFRTHLQKLPIPIKKASLRLRVGAQGQRGIWLDFANADIKALLDHKQWLSDLLDLADVVEVGQRVKPLKMVDGDLKLSKHMEFSPWFLTYTGEKLLPTPIWGTVASFTQPGFAVNRVLLQSVREALAQCQVKEVIEMFSGLGNFSLALASWGYKVKAYEVEASCKWAFAKTSEHYPELASQIEFYNQDLYKKSNLPSLKGQDLVFVDPPRSGLGRFAEHLVNEAPEYCLYVSCFAQSFVQDLATLSAAGYKILFLQGVDQFPQTPHCEWVCLLHKQVNNELN